MESAHRSLRALEGAAEDLIAGGSLEDILHRIATRASADVPGSGHLLVLSMPDGTRHVTCRGTGALLLDALGSGTTLNTADPALSGLPPILTVPVASARQPYGMLAVVARRDSRSLPEHRGTLEAYARHTALTMDVAGLLAETREESKTSQLLLEVASTLNSRSTIKDVAQ